MQSAPPTRWRRARDTSPRHPARSRSRQRPPQRRRVTSRRSGQGGHGSGYCSLYENPATCRAQPRRQNRHYCPRVVRSRNGAVLRWRAAEHNRPRRAALALGRRSNEIRPPIAAMSQWREDDAALWGACFAAAANATFSPSTRFWRAPAPAGDGPRSSARCGARTP
jgi:hypothetical protein